MVLNGPIKLCKTKTAQNIAISFRIRKAKTCTMTADFDTMLFHAVGKGNADLVCRFIQNGADPNARDYNYCTPIHVAAARNLEDIVLYLIEISADLNCKDACGNSALDVAISKNHSSVAAVLQQAGAKQSPPCVIRYGSPERILNRHFPMDIACAMTQSCKTAPIQKQRVSIFFSDILDYSVLRSRMDPVVLSKLLERLFTKFDLLAHQYRVQRIDANDGCYMAATNFSRPQTGDHALRLARFALAAAAAAAHTHTRTDTHLHTHTHRR